MTTATPHAYQTVAIDLIDYTLSVLDEPGAGILLDPGLGKTLISLFAVERFRERAARRPKILIIAPLRVCYSVWPAEVKKWGFPFTCSIVHGTATGRRNALARQADIYLINPEGVMWLERQAGVRFDFTIIDESTCFKSWDAKRTKALKKLLPRLGKRWILTGTPIPKSIEDLFAQIYMVDGGERLGKAITLYRSKYMRPGGYRGHGWESQPGALERVEEAVRDIVLCMRAEDHLDMPSLVTHEIWVDLPPAARTIYDRLEDDLFAALEGGELLTATSAGALYAKCRQLANGGSYYYADPLLPVKTDRRMADIHESKVDALHELVDELQGKPLLVAYQFGHDAERILRRWPKALVIRGGQKPKETNAIIDRWNAKEIPLLLVQPKALSHGANMQAGGNDLAWFGLTNELEKYEQLNRRIYRQGVVGQVRIHHLLTRGTIEEAVLANIQSKAEGQNALLNALADYRRGRNV